MHKLTYPLILIGFLQFLFLAGATEHPIQQHCTLQAGQASELYKVIVPPCACSSVHKAVVHVMWTSTLEGSAPNHVIPLLPLSCNSQGKFCASASSKSFFCFVFVNKLSLPRSALAFPFHQRLMIHA